jgi:phosphatidylinositol alpha 1,6-mannosyltransferase
VRIAIVTESFLPSLNGVTTSVCRVLEELRADGHEAVVIAPDPAPPSHAGFRVHRVASVPVRSFRVGLPTAEIVEVLRAFGPDVVHLASPFVLGARGLAAAQQLGIPSVAIYQTDMPSYLQQHSPGVAGRAASRAAWRWVRRIHGQADLTLAPSSTALADLRDHGVPRTRLWTRGVDTQLFHPGRREEAAALALRARLGAGGRTVVGYVGRLAPEKEVHRLAELGGNRRLRLVVVGEGPCREALAGRLPGATFLGRLEGVELARAYAAMDVFAHTGTRETFGQTLQEAAATGLPVVAPARGGPLDLVRHGRTGLLFDPDRPGDLRRRVDQLTEGPAAARHRTRMGEAGRAAVRGRSWTTLVDELLGHYEAAGAGRTARRTA